MNIDFKGKTVIVTGGTRGIGKSIAENFKNSNANLILTGTNKKEIDELNSAVSNGEKTKYLHLDFRDESVVNDFLFDLKKVDKIDVLINNAGINRINYIYETKISDWDDIINVNLKGPFILIKEISQIMMKFNYGRIVNMASVFGTVTREKRSVYTTSKSGLIGITKTASVDLAKFNILVNSVSPGFILTDLTKSILSVEEIKDLESRIPMGRFGTIDEIANLVLFLSSDINSYLTGQNIIIDGGFVNV